MTRTPLLSLFLLPLLLGATPPPESAATPGEAASAAVPPVVAARMAKHFQLAMAIQRGVVAGDLETARASGKELAALDGKWPEPWAPHMENLMRQVDQVAAAPTLQDMAAQSAGLAQACADCHTALSGGPKVEVDDIPPQQFGKRGMGMHLWGISWMWYGLAGPNDQAWKRGADTLHKADLWPRTLEGPTPDGFQKLDLEVHKLAEEAQTAKAPERQRIFGDLLATCATCHDWVDAGPDSTP